MTDVSTKETLNRLSDAIAHVLAPEKSAQSMDVSPLSTKARASTFKVGIDGQVGFLKLFADTADGQAAFDRERRALDGFHELDVPTLLLVAEKDRAILTGFIDGTSMSDSLTAQTLAQMAEFLGQWFGRLANNAPRGTISENWFDYLSQYETGFDRDTLSSQKSLLEAIHPSHTALAHNDNALGNFILAKDKKLYGVDFEDTQTKPEGWDLIAAARALFLRFPDQLQSISSSLCRGYKLTCQDNQLDKQFDQVINAAVVANLVERD